MEYLQELSRKIRALSLYPHPLRYLIARQIDARFREKRSYYERIIQGDVRRSHYAWCMYEAARLAKEFGERKISILEFGVAGGMGLLQIEKHAEQIEKEFDIQFECFGFGLELGLPESSDYRDLLYQHRPNSFKMDLSKLELHLTRTKLVIGDVKTAVKTFFRQYKPSPIGAIMFDLDYYTSTRDALAIFSESHKYYLPRIHLYFDDIKLTNEFVGELLAISEFNLMNEKKKIAHPYKFEQYFPNIESGERIFAYHDFSHPLYNHNSSTELAEAPIIEEGA